MTVFRLERAQNGGWIVLPGDHHPGVIPVVIGAYTTTGDALVGLAKLMRDLPAPMKEGCE
jgi:hypothetical protein